MFFTSFFKLISSSFYVRKKIRDNISRMIVNSGSHKLFARYIRKNRHYIAPALTKRAIVYCSLFRLKRSSYRVSECRVAWNISLRDQHIRQSHTLVSPPTFSLSSEVLNFIFNPLRVLYHVATSGGYFFCDFTFSPRRSLHVARKKKERESMCGAVSLVAGNIFARRQ